MGLPPGLPPALPPALHPCSSTVAQLCEDEELSGIPQLAAAEEVLELKNAQWRLDRFLRFTERKIELRYILETAEKPRKTALWMAGLYAVICAAFLAIFGSGFATSVDIVCNIGVLLNAAQFAFFFVAMKLRLLGVEQCAAAGAFTVPLLSALSNRYRVSKALGVGGYDTAYYADDSLYILNLIIVVQSVVLLNGRFAVVWWAPVWSVVVYASSSIGGLGPHPGMTPIFTSIILFTVSMMAVISGYRIERELRDRWVGTLKLRVEWELQRLALAEQEARTQELQALLSATEQQPPAKAEVGRLSTMDGRTGAVPLPPLPPPAPPPRKSQRRSAMSPNDLLKQAVAGRSLDVQRLRKMSRSIRAPGYGLREFFDDAVAAFPELSLFFAEPLQALSSGLTAEVEYQRTIGALFAVYWLVRLDLDGKDGFCFGHDLEDWAACKAHSKAWGSARGRRLFYNEIEWSYLEQVVEEALGGSEERLQAMLCLTAFHDIMKVPALCPMVMPSHAPYAGYEAGDIINDHDAALAYILEKFPEMVPSYRELPPELQAIILFTQQQLHFNHGWFVQAEATPGAMLSKFKAALCHARPADLAFYFFHWLTDLSGAEGQPLAGAEKFVLRFPRSVLTSFLWSMPFVEQLAEEGQTETAVMQRYLEARAASTASLEVPLQPSPEAVALLRLTVMAQQSGSMVVTAFWGLPELARDVLAVELARTGIADQCFTLSPQQGGPALFVYYGPALLQRCATPEEMHCALLTLAAIYRAGRLLWPRDPGDGGTTVALEAGVVKANMARICAGRGPDAAAAFLDAARASGGAAAVAFGALVLERRSRTEGAVALVQGQDLNRLAARPASMAALELRHRDWLPPEPSGSEQEEDGESEDEEGRSV